MKQIKNVTKDGIEYIDEDGKSKFIDLDVCYKNWLTQQRQDPHYDDRAQQLDLEWKCVGQRDRFAQPPYIEFFTEPMIRFEFISPEEGFHTLRRAIEKAGWRTSDLA